MMLKSWLIHLKHGLSRDLPKDSMAKQNDSPGYKKGFKNLFPIVQRHFSKCLFGVVLVLLTTLCSFPQPLIMRYIVDDVILLRQLSFLAGAIFLLVGISLAGKLISLLQNFCFMQFEQEIMLDIQKDLIERTLSAPKSFFDDQETGYLMSRLSTDIQGLQVFFSSTIIHIIANMLRFAGGVGLLFYLEWRLALCALIILPGIILSLHYFSSKIHILSHHHMEQQATVSSGFQEYLSSALLVKAFSSENCIVKRLSHKLKIGFQIMLEQTAVSSLARSIIEAIPGLARVLILALGAFLVIRDQWTLGSLLAFQSYLGYVFGPVQFLASANLQFQHAFAALERVSTLFDIVPERKTNKGRHIKRLKGEITFGNVSFTYNNRSGPVLTDISFQIHPGEHVAIMGPSGAGKTTLLSLILCFYRPTAGEIYFDNEPATSVNRKSLRRHIGYVPQSQLLLSGTMMENLCFGNPGASKQQVIKAAKVANLHEFIESLPEGYQTRIGERGVYLSEGQKQRISIARALVKDPEILLLDEPTSAMDIELENAVSNELCVFAQDKTLIVVTHRLPIIKNIDRIFWLDNTGLK